MNTTKKLMTLLLALLALTACDSNDEPDHSKDPRIYMAVSDLDHGYVFDDKGNTIYECPINSVIKILANEGNTWYAVRATGLDGESVQYDLLRNGEVMFPFTDQVRSMCVVNGDVYTLQSRKKGDAPYPRYLIYKNEELLYEHYVYGRYFHSFDVVDGHLVAGVHDSFSGKAIYWIDGEFYTYPSEDNICLDGYAREGENELLVLKYLDYSQDNLSPNKYSFNGILYELPNDFITHQSMIVNGIPYISGWHDYQAFLIVNGVEHPLENEPIGLLMKRYGDSVYILASSSDDDNTTNSQIFKLDEQPVDLSAIVNLKHLDDGDKNLVPLSETFVEDFIVLPPK